MPTEKQIQDNLNENRSQLREALDNIDRAVRSFRDSLTLGQAPKARIDTVIRLRTMVDTLVAADAIRCCYLEQLENARKDAAVGEARHEALEGLYRAARAEAPFGSRTRLAAERVTDLERGNPAFDRLHPAEKLVLQAKEREAARKAEEEAKAKEAERKERESRFPFVHDGPLGRVVFDDPLIQLFNETHVPRAGLVNPPSFIGLDFRRRSGKSVALGVDSSPRATNLRIR